MNNRICKIFIFVKYKLLDTHNCTICYFILYCIISECTVDI